MLEYQPMNAWAWRYLAFFECERDRFSEAQMALKQAAKYAPLHPQQFYQQVTVHLRTGKFSEALSVLCDGLDYYPSSMLLVSLIKHCGETIAEQREAFLRCKQRIFKGDNDGYAILEIFDQVQLLLDENEQRSAVDELKALRPDSWIALVVQIRISKHLNDLGIAKELSEVACEKFPYHKILWEEKLGIQLSCSEFEESLFTAKHLTLLDGFSLDSMRCLARIYLALNDSEKYLDVMTQALSRDCSNESLLISLAYHHHNQGSVKEALSYAERAMLSNPTSINAWVATKDIYASLHELTRLEKIGDKLTNQYPEHPAVWTFLGESQYLGKWNKEAISSFETALIFQNSYVPALRGLATALAETGDILKAREICATVVPTQRFELKQLEAILIRKHQNLEAGRVLLRDALLKTPWRFDDWQMLADWCSEDDDVVLGLEAARQMIKAEPANCVGYGYLSIFLVQNEEAAAAVEALLIAVDLSPQYIFAIEKLIELFRNGYIASEEHLVDVIERAAPYSSADEINYWRFEIANHSKDVKLANELRVQLLTSPSVSNYCVDRLVRELTPDSMKRRLKIRIIRGLMDIPEVNPRVAYWWYQAMKGNEKYILRTDIHQVADLCRKFPSFAETLCYEYYDPDGIVPGIFPTPARSYLRLLAMKHPLSWGAYGAAMINQKRYHLAVISLADYAHRSGVQAWMLCNLSNALLYVYELELAKKVALDGLELSSDSTKTSLHSIVAFFCLMEDDVEGALEHYSCCEVTDTRHLLSSTCYRLVEVLLSLKGLVSRPKATADDLLQSMTFEWSRLLLAQGGFRYPLQIFAAEWALQNLELDSVTRNKLKRKIGFSVPLRRIFAAVLGMIFVFLCGVIVFVGYFDADWLNPKFVTFQIYMQLVILAFTFNRRRLIKKAARIIMAGKLSSESAERAARSLRMKESILSVLTRFTKWLPSYPF